MGIVPYEIGICRGGIQQNCELKASPGGSCHGAAVTDEGKRSLQMQPTADINQKGLPSSDLASLGHLSRLPARSALLPAAEMSTGHPRPKGRLMAGILKGSSRIFVGWSDVGKERCHREERSDAAIRNPGSA